MFLHLPSARHPVTALAGTPTAPPWVWLLVTTAAALTGAAAATVVTHRRWRRRADTLSQQAATWRHQALHDDLTGLPNRAAAYTWLQHHHGHPVGLVLLDLDQFKTVNDSHGHAAGDLVLHHVATQLRTLIDGHGLAARLGGDEFLLLLDQPRRATELATRAAALLHATPAIMGAHSLSCEASFGVATTGGGTDPDQLLAQADTALFQAKRTSKWVVTYQPTDTTPPTAVPTRPTARRRDQRRQNGDAG
jgi:diguanylate cyclase (GGDEF)-like protein